MNYSHVTVCFSLPRSRSQWLAWLYRHRIEAWHDPLKLCAHPLDLKRMIDETGGNRRLFIADTAAILFHQAIAASLPGAAFVYVVRPLTDVLDSVHRQGVHANPELTAMLSYMHAKLLTKADLSTHRCWYEQVDAHARQWWEAITGNRPPTMDFFDTAAATHIDVPLRDQPNYPEKTRRLLMHAE